MDAIHVQQTRIAPDTDRDRLGSAEAALDARQSVRAPRNSREECLAQCEALDRVEGRRFEVFPPVRWPTGYAAQLRRRLALARLRRWETVCDVERAPYDPCALADLRREEAEIRACLRLLRALTIRGQ